VCESTQQLSAVLQESTLDGRTPAISSPAANRAAAAAAHSRPDRCYPSADPNRSKDARTAKPAQGHTPHTPQTTGIRMKEQSLEGRQSESSRLERRETGTQAHRHSGTQALRQPTQALRHSGTQALRHSGTQALRHSGTQALRHSDSPLSPFADPRTSS